MRLDLWLVKNKYYESRNKSQNAIINGKVFVNNLKVDKSNYGVKDNDVIIVKDNEEYVSRGAYKLLKALNNWNIDLTNKIILDVGASTGGFTDVCLKKGASFVYAVDVGSEQLHSSLRRNTKIKSIENMHFKNLDISMFYKQIDFIVADVSFISLTKLIDKLQNLFNYKYKCIFLIKPQFELSPKEIKGGKVKEEILIQKAINKIKEYSIEHQYEIYGVIPSPVKGNKLGNQEYLIYMEKK